MNLIQHAGFPVVEVPPAQGNFSYRNAWNEVMTRFHEAGFRVREPRSERRELSPCHEFAWFFVVAGLGRHHEVLVVDQVLTPVKEEAILRGAFGVINQYPDAALHVYSAEELSPRMCTALADTPAGCFLRRVGVEVPISDIRPMGVPYVAPRIVALMEECWRKTIDLDSPGEVLAWLDDVVMEYRGDRSREVLLPTPGAVLTPPLAAIGLVVADILRRHLPGPTKIHAAAPRGGFERQEDDRLEAQDWAFVVVVAGGKELQYVYGPGTVFARYCQGDDQSLVSLLPPEIAFPDSEEARAFVESLPD
mgnify:CR=1 FL=1